MKPITTFLTVLLAIVRVWPNFRLYLRTTLRMVRPCLNQYLNTLALVSGVWFLGMPNRAA